MADTNTGVKQKALANILSALAPEPSTEEKNVYLHRILDSLYNNKPETASPTKKAEANTGLSYVASADSVPVNNVEVSEDYYVPQGGLGFDVLTPKRPNIDWFSSDNAKGVNEEDVKSALSVMEEPKDSVEQPVVPTETPTTEEIKADLSGLNVSPMRQRRSKGAEALAMAKDVFDFVSGVDPNAYIGKTLEGMNRYDETRAKEDPEGYQADMNRAKVLSQKAYNETDPEVKKKYGAAIKKLLPYETQGLDDLTASEFLVSAEKMEIEKLKAATQLAKQKLANEGGLNKVLAQNENRIAVQEMKNEAQNEHDKLNYELRTALSDKDYAKASMIRDRMEELEQIKNAADYQKAVDVANINATSKEGIAKINAQSRVDVANINALSREQVAQLKANIKATSNGMNEIGDIIPSQGIVDAVKIIEGNPNQFDEMAGWLDTGFGRFFGLLSGKAVRNRSEATMALQEAVTGSVMNLMKLFPKGGASVINSGTEQKRFAPIAEIIASGRGNKIVPALKAYYGGLFDAAQKVAGERAPITREQYVNLMMYGNTGGKNGSGLNMISRDIMGMSTEGIPTIKRTQPVQGALTQQITSALASQTPAVSETSATPIMPNQENKASTVQHTNGKRIF